MKKEDFYIHKSLETGGMAHREAPRSVRRQRDEGKVWVQGFVVIFTGRMGQEEISWSWVISGKGIVSHRKNGPRRNQLVLGDLGQGDSVLYCRSLIKGNDDGLRFSWLSYQEDLLSPGISSP